MPLARIPDEQREVALDLVYDRRRPGYDPLARMLELFEGVDATSAKAERAAEFASLPLEERLKRRIIDGERNGLEADLDLALTEHARPGDRQRHPARRHEDGRRAVRLRPDAAAVRAAVGRGDEGRGRLPGTAHGEDRRRRRGTIVLATVRGDVHDIGKNLVDIILSNNGYEVVNIGIKQPISAIIAAAEEHNADVIGMSGLLVKSTVVMRDNLAELNARGLAERWPVLLGGAALTRAYVEQDLAALFEGEVRYARDAFEGLRLMDAAMAVKHGVPGAALPALRQRRVSRPAAIRRGRRPGRRPRRDRPLRRPAAQVRPGPADVARRQPACPSRRSGAPASSRACRSPSTRPTSTSGPRSWASGASSRPRKAGGPSYEELVETEGRPRLRMWLERAQTEGLLQAAVVYGYFRCVSEGDDLIVLSETGQERERFTFPRQQRDERLCLADFFRPARRARPTWSPSSSPPWARRCPGRPPSCSRGTPTASTWSCTACRSSSPRPSPSTGTSRVRAGTRHRRRGPGRPRRLLQRQVPGRPVLDRLPGLPGPGRPGQDRPAAASRSGSASSCPRRCSCTPSSPPTPSSSTTRLRDTSACERDSMTDIGSQRCCSTWTACWSTPSRSGSRPRPRSWRGSARPWTKEDQEALLGGSMEHIGRLPALQGHQARAAGARSSAG